MAPPEGRGCTLEEKESREDQPWDEDGLRLGERRGEGTDGLLESGGGGERPFEMLVLRPSKRPSRCCCGGAGVAGGEAATKRGSFGAAGQVAFKCPERTSQWCPAGAITEL
ncbi:hypothetical protein EMIHUDRAFT_213485 [Emiliania huxleyi CCMP1516]|uniref:Uncharacterized protein n=2 Tax=Emiliania huxleyi TaxID=2903 RepID=A0A0D3IN58_EMIH1|nr:hypothetical protein EMIHUDRAFT_213485 [Emiliania huxleyi CCMP1516]EOD12693.1 hypothetical protein EMIHUDRAFT_213485 [Emiliania huxleyi CCMP1516]|eukprot:XP_005765122.1 hypothetical protein EMIHUDRAFT_213485 [Emiliania huxleyi CCMP1516]